MAPAKKTKPRKTRKPASKRANRKMTWATVAGLTLYEDNPVVHSKAQLEALARSIQEFGWTNPVLIDESNVVIAGHARLKAATQLGITRVPVIYLNDLTPDQVRAYRIADNRLAEMAQWDDVALAGEVQALKEGNYNLEFTGLSVDDLNELLGPIDTGHGEDETPDRPTSAKTKPGDLYLLGDHRLVCGDATKEAGVALCLDGQEPHIMVTDPPYGVNYDAEWRSREGMNKKHTDRPKILGDDQVDWQTAWELFPGSVAYVWHSGLFSGPVALSLAAAGFGIRSQIIWNKNRFAISRGQYHWRHDPCWYAVRKGKASAWTGSRRQSTVWDIDIVDRLDFKHPNQKPVECMRRPLINNSRPGDCVYDPFAGVGTTLIAAEATGRICYTIELDPAWCDVIVKRWEDRTGYKAERVRKGGSRSGKAKRAGKAKK